jgi:hypothetical protein
MIITINTKEDSRDEIKKVINMLQNLLSESAVSNSTGDMPVPGEGIFGLFDSPALATNAVAEPPKEEQKEEETAHMEIYEY